MEEHHLEPSWVFWRKRSSEMDIWGWVSSVKLADNPEDLATVKSSFVQDSLINTSVCYLLKM
jgi:hypothetical protein